MRPLLVASLAGLLACGSVFSYGSAFADTPRPNIVLIVADDLGRSDVGFNGGEIRTPNLDRLAATGVRLDRFYACPVCSPTRAGLMTGRWPLRYGLMRTVIPPWSDYGLPLSEQTLPEVLAGAGYERRGMVGKWHLGHARREFLPLSRGFTSFYGHYNAAIDYFTHLREGEVDWHRDEATVKEEGYATDLLAAEAARFVEAAPAGSPYFLYVAFNTPHSPYQAKEDDLARYPDLKGNRRTYAAMVDCLDQGVGRILAAIESRPDADDTFVLFFSDNGGPVRPARNAPLRDGKFSVYEGGVRVAAAVRWPAGGLAGGRVCAEPVGYVDVLPTLRRVAGAEPRPSDPPADGIDVLDALRGERPVPQRPWFSYVAPAEGEQAAVTFGDWKLVARGTDVLSPETPSDATLELYDLGHDPGERNDLAAEQADRVEELRRRLVEFGRLRPEQGVAPYAEGRRGFKAPKDWVIR
ncbi:MAG TPA: arylsulfatase [Planctomycetaceae bacterium]